jgi:hypothetical protein
VKVLGIDVALLNTGVAEIRDGKATWRSTITVEGEPTVTGPRFAVLRRAFEKLVSRTLRNDPPAVVAVEEPELGIRKGHGVEAVLKLYGAFAVIFAEATRLWPRSRVIGVMPKQWKGHLSKDMTASIMRAKYKVECDTSHAWDALGIADYAWECYCKHHKRLT